MQELAWQYYDTLRGLMGSIEVTDRTGQGLPFDRGVEEACRLILSPTPRSKKLLFIGNGASAAISSHMATDFWKNGGIRAVAFNDSSLLTCIGNDYGYEFVFEKPIEMFAESADILMAISSSGRSPNILNGVKSAEKRDCRIITFSGFYPDNPLRAMGDLNFFVPIDQYGPVEILHHSLCHCILDIIISYGVEDNKKKGRNS